MTFDALPWVNVTADCQESQVKGGHLQDISGPSSDLAT